MWHRWLGVVVTGGMLAVAGCQDKGKPATHPRQEQAVEATHDRSAEQTVVYVAQLHPLNEKAAGSRTVGQARIVQTGKTLTITINVQGAPANIEHWQHFHGFKDGRAASCPPASADKNNDGIIDLIETEGSAGTTMVPFNAQPAQMQVASHTYPKADKDGNYHYQQTVPLDQMKKAFGDAFGGADLDLEKRVIFIHGVAPNTKLPGSVQSLGAIPAHVTLPIACGKIERVQR